MGIPRVRSPGRWYDKIFAYGYGRVEDIAGVLIVAIILFSTVFAGYEAIYRLLHPQSIVALGWVALGGLAGFAGNEVVAVLRIRVGREIDSAALIAVAPGLALADANLIAAALEAELVDHLPALAEACIRFDRSDAVARPAHSHALDPFRFEYPLAAGALTIIDTDAGERFQLTISRGAGLEAVVRIDRGAGGIERLGLAAIAGQPATYLSAVAPEEPHEFDAVLDLQRGEARVELPFHMAEPEHHN